MLNKQMALELQKSNLDLQRRLAELEESNRDDSRKSEIWSRRLSVIAILVSLLSCIAAWVAAFSGS